jgi:hypothetical protein
MWGMLGGMMGGEVTESVRLGSKNSGRLNLGFRWVQLAEPVSGMLDGVLLGKRWIAMLEIEQCKS